MGCSAFSAEGNLPFESTSHVRPTDTSLKVGVRFPPPTPVGLRPDFQASQMPALGWLPLVQALEHSRIRAHSLSVLSSSAQMASLGPGFGAPPDQGPLSERAVLICSNGFPLVQALEHARIRAHSLSVLSPSAQMAS